jgi:hypothetical protein
MALLIVTSAGPCTPQAPGAQTTVETSFEGPSARLTLEAGDRPPGSVRVELWAGTTPVSRAEGPLPLMLAAPRATPLMLVVEAPGRERYVEELELTADRTLTVPLPRGQRITGRTVDARSRPVSGAEIRLLPAEGMQVVWVARSGDDGRFSFDTLREGSYRLEARAPGFDGITRDSVSVGSNVRLVLGRVGRVAGRIVRPDGAPAEGATVIIAGSGLWPARQASSGDDGRFVLADIPAGIYEVRAFRGDLVAVPMRGLVVEEGEPRYLTFNLRPGAAIRGVVRDATTDQPIAAAEVTVSLEELDAAPRADLTNAEGRFSVGGLRDGVHRVSVFAEGYVPVNAIEWQPGPLLELELEPAAILAGIVVDEDRQPIEGAQIEVLGDTEDRQPVALGLNSAFRTSVFSAQLTPFEALPATHARLEVTEGPVPPIPVAPLGMPETAFAPIPASATEARLSASYFSDQHGRFRVIGVPPGHVQVVARRAGRAPAATERIYVTAGSERDDLVLVLPPAGRLVGTVLDERRAGVAGVLIEVRSDREPFPRIAVSEHGGTFAVQDVFGELTVTATPPGRPAARATASVGSGEEAEVELLLEGTLHELSGRTVDEGGFPLAGVQMGLTSLRADAPLRRTFFSGEDGTFSLTMLPAPPWRIDASDPERASTTLDVVSSDRPVQVVLAMGARVSGSVSDDYSGEPVLARVVLRRDALPAETIETRTDGEGGFFFGRVRPGVWTLTIESDDHLTHERTVEVVSRGRTVRDVELDAISLDPAGSISGTVVDASGAPIGRARVTQSGVEGGPSATSDADGEFVLRGLAAGMLTLRAAHPAAGEGESRTSRVFAGTDTPGVVVRLSERFDPERAASLPGRQRGVAILAASAGGRVTVREVMRGSRAERVGLRAGDVLLEIDGTAPESAGQAARLLAGSTDVPAILRVQRDDTEAIVVVERETWLPP